MVRLTLTKWELSVINNYSDRDCINKCPVNVPVPTSFCANQFILRQMLVFVCPLTLNLTLQFWKTWIGFDQGKWWSCWVAARPRSSAARRESSFWPAEWGSLKKQVTGWVYVEWWTWADKPWSHVLFLLVIIGNSYKKWQSAWQTRPGASLLRF